jgi:hypothetical protein
MIFIIISITIMMIIHNIIIIIVDIKSEMYSMYV